MTPTLYEIIDTPTNGTTGQHCGTFALCDLPERLRAAIDAEPHAGEWILPALAEGDSGAELSDLRTIVRLVPGHSATVNLTLTVAGHMLPCSHVGPERVRLAQPAPIEVAPGAAATVTIEIDGAPETMAVSLPKGIGHGDQSIETASA